MSAHNSQHDAIEHAFGESVGSKALWERCPQLDILLNPGKGVIFFEDFVAVNKGKYGAIGASGSATTYPAWAWSRNGVNKAAVSHLTSVAGHPGIARLTAAQDDATADIGVTMQLQGLPFILATGMDLWFEAMIRIGNPDNQFYIGLAEDEVAAGLYGASGGVNVASNHLGLGDLYATTAGGTFFHSEKVDEYGYSAAAIHTPTTATWYRYGFHVSDRAANGTYAINVYVDGALVAVYNASTTDDIVPSTDMPIVALTPTFYCGTEDGSTTSVTLDIDWVKVVQQRTLAVI